MSDATSGAGTFTQIPLSVPVLDGRETEYVNEALASRWVSTGGPFITRFEDAVREVTGARNAVACVNGTAAIQVALRLAGVRAGDEVIVPTLTFIATVNAVACLGAHPVFVDCDDFMNTDPAAVASFLAEECVSDGDALVDRETGRRVAAIVPVHVFGNPCDLAPLLATADRFRLPVVEDAAESLGSSWTAGPLAGRHTGTCGLFGAVSFNANKIVTSGGGGMILTEDDDLAERARYLTTTAKDDAVRFVHNELGYNFRITNLNAAVGVAQMETLAARIETKRRNYALYRQALADVRGVELLGVPEGTNPNCWFYSLVVDAPEYGRDRESLMLALDAEGIQTRPVWHLNHWQRPYRDERAYHIERAVWFWERVLNLPCTSDLTESDVGRVADAIRRFGGA
jgi:perosamine synthetase